MGAKKNKILFVTQWFSCGSWICIDRILKRLIDYNNKIYVLGLGKNYDKKKKVSYFCLPYFRYDRWGFITVWNPLISFLWILPIFILGIFSIFINQPKIVISNGLTLGLSLGPFIKLIGSRSIIMYHSYIGKYGRFVRAFLKFLSNTIDLVVVNSKGSFCNINLIVNSNKIVMNEHSVEDFFFDGSLEYQLNQPFTILYVGRLDRDKFCFILIEIAKRLKDNKEFLFLFVGVGEYAREIKKLERESSNVKYLGYIENKLELRQLYQRANIVWSFADESYLALPATEALACGRPIIIPKIPALGPDKIYSQIDKELVPGDIGWIVDPYNIQEIIEKLIWIKEQKIDYSMQKICRDYAKQKYSNKNLQESLDRIIAILKNE